MALQVIRQLSDEALEVRDSVDAAELIALGTHEWVANVSTAPVAPPPADQAPAGRVVAIVSDGEATTLHDTADARELVAAGGYTIEGFARLDRGQTTAIP